MKNTISTAYALSVAAAVTLLSGCSGTSQIGSSAIPSHSIADRQGVRPPLVPHLFVSDLGTGPGSGVVQVFSYPNNTLAFTLSGFNTPAGECVDGSGNVYVVDTGASAIQEYTNAGAFVHTLNDPGQNPAACAVRQAPYRVAVSNGASGSISVYNGAATSPTSVFSNSTKFTTVAYMDYHTGSPPVLYLDGSGMSGPFTFGKMSAAGAFTVIPVSGGPAAPGGVQQPPGKLYLAVGDASSNTIYHIRPNGVLAVSNPPANPNPTVLSNSCNSFGDFYIDRITTNERVVINPETCMSKANEYKFPAGGPPGQQFTSPLISPVGVVVSK
jgi:hypothetical protein